MRNSIIVMSTISCLLLVSCSRNLTDAEKAEVAQLKTEHAALIEAVNQTKEDLERYNGGTLSLLIRNELAALTISAEMVRQRILQIETGSDVDVVSYQTVPDPDLAKSLESDLENAKARVEEARVNSSMYSGGLVKSLSLMTQATAEQSLALLQSKYLTAKYGLGFNMSAEPLEIADSKTGKEKQTPPTPVVATKASLPPSDGPLGLEMGLNKETLEKMGVNFNREASSERGTFFIDSVPKPNGFFETYVVKIGTQSGLCWVKAITPTLSTNSFGSSLKTKHADLVELIEQSYGKPVESKDRLFPGSIWDDPQDWMMSMVKSERVFYAKWGTDTPSGVWQSIQNIYTGISTSNTSEGYVSLEYYFDNYSKCEEENKKSNAEGL